MITKFSALFLLHDSVVPYLTIADSLFYNILLKDQVVE